jgi:acyl transferase domain-containing protein/acyl carrier protein
MNQKDENPGYSSLLEEAYLQLRDMSSRLEAARQAKNGPIAVIGIGCRFPGGADTPEKFWQQLRDGVDTVTEVPAQRWNIDDYYHPDPDMPGKMYTRNGSFIENADGFDAQFFGISPREAVGIDPQQRLLMEVSWEALENAGQVPGRLSGSKTGVFMGLFMADYSLSLYRCRHSDIDAYKGIGVMRSLAAGRLAYALNLHGPAIQVDTACSSALLAVHLACQALRTGECRQALAGGANLVISPENSIGLSKMTALSVDGRCKTFDAKADGYGRGEGCGVVVLKRLSDALTDNDNIQAVIRGSAVNHNGRSNGITAPSSEAQEKVIRDALEMAGLSMDRVQYLETHGTGTPLGDPIEMSALQTLLGPTREKPLIIGSVKTNHGHLEAAAGIAGLIKVLLSIRHGRIPPHLHFNEPSPYIPWDEIPVQVPTKTTDWPTTEEGRVAGVSSFGLSGTNAHVIVTEAPETDAPGTETKDPLPEERTNQILCLSAQSETALISQARRYGAFLETQTDESLADICYTANTGRTHFFYRRAIVAATSRRMQKQLEAIANDKEDPGQIKGRADAEPAGIAFLFTGQGAQYEGMGRVLYETQPLVRQILDRCHEISRDYMETPLLEIMYPAEQSPPTSQSMFKSPIDLTSNTQPALFALEYALARLWQSWGIRPAAVMGHSFGEYVAACIAGVFSMEDGMKLVAERGRLIRRCCQTGKMMVISVNEEEAAEIIRPYTGEVSIAAVNGPGNVVLSGWAEAIDTIMEQLKGKEIKTKLLQVSHAFHSPMLEPMMPRFRQAASEVSYNMPKIPVCSNVTGQLETVELTTPEYWCRHTLEPVRFAAGMETLDREGSDIYVEIGPKPILLGMGRQCLGEEERQWVVSLRPDQDDWQEMLRGLGELYVRGIPVDWAGFDNQRPRRKMSLPTYPFQRMRFWLQEDVPQIPQGGGYDRRRQEHPLLGHMLYTAGTPDIRFEARFSDTKPAWAVHHKVYEHTVMPGAAYLEMAAASGMNYLKANTVLLRDVAIQHALILTPEKTSVVQTVLTPGNPGEYEFKIYSTSDEGNGVPQWVCHVSGEVAGDPDETESHPVEIEYLKECCKKSLMVEEQYRRSEESGIQYGIDFKGIRELWQGNGESLGRVKLPTEPAAEAGAYILHPALLDACFQVGIAALPVEPGSAYLPVNVKEYRVNRKDGTGITELWVHAQLTEIHPKAQSITAGMRLFDHRGRTVARLEGITIQRVAAETLQRSMRRESDRLYEIEWQAENRREQCSPPENGRPGIWLIFNGTDVGSISTRLGERLRADGDNVLEIQPRQTEMTCGKGCCRIAPCAPGDIRRIIREEVEERQQHCRGIVLVGGGDSGEPVETAYEECQRFLHLIQSIIRTEWKALPRLWLVTRNSQAVSTEFTDPIRLEQAPLWGMARVVTLEHPELHMTCLDLDGTESENEADDVAAEMRGPSKENMVAWRKGGRYVPRLVRQKEVTQGPPPRFRQDGSFLITGGLGGLGLKTARWLVARGARHLILTGRSKPTPEAVEILEQLREDGADIRVEQADISRESDVRELLDKIRAAEPPLRGIIHAAGVHQVDTLEQQTPDGFRKVMMPKVAGSWYLHHHTRELPLDFFVCFSSMSALVGAMGQSNYVAANTFMDALAHYRRAWGLTALSIDWGAWAEVGMLARQDERYRNQVKEEGIIDMTPEECLELFGGVIGRDSVQVGVMTVEWPVYARQFPTGDIPPYYSGLLTPPKETDAAGQRHRLTQLKAAEPGERSKMLQAAMQENVAHVLRLPVEQVDSRQPLTDMGIDSLMALELRNRIKNQLNVAVPVVRFLEDVTLLDLVEHVTEKMQSVEASEKSTSDEVRRHENLMDVEL